jgi:glycosyltransferase involved in cell wall biosynthesis
MKILVAALSVTGNAKIRTGVERFYASIAKSLEKEGHTLFLYEDDKPIDVDKFDIKNMASSLFSSMVSKKFQAYFEKIQPDAVHIPIELGVGLAARKFCLKKGIPFTTAFHTNLPLLLYLLFRIPETLTWKYLRWFHKPAAKTHVFTERMQDWLRSHGFEQPLPVIPPGVDNSLFYYDPDPTFESSHPRPYFIYAGRVTREKNIEAFLDLDLPGTKFVVGSGPVRDELMKKYSGKALFFTSEHLRKLLSNADVFVLPSRFETFGIVQLEALSCGLPVAGFPVMGPLDVIEQGVNGYALEDLKEAALKCLTLNKDHCIHSAKRFTWDETAKGFSTHQIRFDTK